MPLQLSCRKFSVRLWLLILAAVLLHLLLYTLAVFMPLGHVLPSMANFFLTYPSTPFAQFLSRCKGSRINYASMHTLVWKLLVEMELPQTPDFVIEHFRPQDPTELFAP